MSISMNAASRHAFKNLNGFFLIALILVLMPVCAMASWDGLDLKKIPAPKEYTFLPAPEFEAKTKVIKEVEPYKDKGLSYTVRLPKSWTENRQQLLLEGSGGEKPLSSTVLGILGRYISAPINLLRSYVVVEAQDMSYEISAQNWFVNFILNNGFSLSALKEVSPQEVEALYVQVENDQTYVVRARLIISGPKLVLIRYYLPQENYEEFKVEQAQVISSFHLLNPSTERIEKQIQFGFLDQSFFNYPSSWSLKSKSILSIERMNALLYQERKDENHSTMDGHIKINLISRLLKTSLSKEVQDFRAAQKIKDYTIADLIENITYHYDPSIKSGMAQAYKLVPKDPVNMKSYEFVVAVMQGDDFYYITSLITPSREQDFYTWAQNMEALRIVNESMRRNPVSATVNANDPYYDYIKKEDAVVPAPATSAPAAPTTETPSLIPPKAPVQTPAVQ